MLALSMSFSRLLRVGRDDREIRGYLSFFAGTLAALGAGWIGFPHAIYNTRRSRWTSATRSTRRRRV